MPRTAWLAGFAALLALALPAAAMPALVGTTHHVPSLSAHDGSAIALHVWEKRDGNRAAAPHGKSAKVLLLAHGATIPGVPDFDLQVAADASGLTYSLMDYFAARGYDVFSVDYQNYGGSDRVPCGKCVTSQVAANDIGAAVDYIRKLRGVERVHLLGWSWGATTAGLYAQQHPDRVARLVQYALYVEHERNPARVPDEEFRKVDMEACCRDDFFAASTDPGVFEAYASQALKWEQRAPNGVYADVFGHMPILDPTRITVPTLMIYGAQDNVCRVDQKDLPGYFRDLATRDKALVIVPEAGHALLLERARRTLYREVENWFAR
jgi:pimeloyl-ACP methyl ester carboxylesterase